MGKMLRVTLLIFASIILLVIVTAIALPFFINPNDFKPEIQDVVNEQTGRELVIKGDLKLSVFPWIGISTGKLTLSNAKGFSDKPFAEITESNIKVKLLPLFSKKVEVSRIVLKGLALNLAKNKQGISNWDDLSASEEPEKRHELPNKTQQHKVEQRTVSPLSALAIGGISIEQANIVWDDQQQGKYTEINDFNINTDKLAFDEPIGIDLSLTVVNKDPEISESISFSTDLVINEQLTTFHLNKVELKSVTTGKEIPGGELTATLLAEIAVDLTQQTLNISDLKLNTGDLLLTANIAGHNIKDKPVFKGPIKIAEFDLAQLMKQMALPLPAMQAPDALSIVSLDFVLQATPDSAGIQNLMIKLDDTNIKGSANIQNFIKPKIDFTIEIDAIDIDRYMAPVKPNDDSKKAVVTPATAAIASASLFPVETLRAFNSNGQLKIGKLKINNLNMQGINLKLNAKNGIIKTQQTVKHLYQGKYTGNSSINVQHKTPTLALNEQLTKVQVEPLLNDMMGEARMTGEVNASAKIVGQGNTAPALKSTLNGNVNFNFKDGVIRGFNLQKIIDNGKALIEGTPLPSDNKNDQTVFSTITGTALINSGLIKNNDLYAEASKLRVNGKGTAHLVSEKLNYTINAKLLKKEATETEPEKLKGIPIVVDIGGDFSKPSYQLNLAAMLTEKNKAKINKKKDELLEKLDKKLGPGAADLLKSLF